MKTKITSIRFAGYGHNKVTIELANGKEYSHTTSDTQSTDLVRGEVYTKKDEIEQRRAVRSLINQVKQANNIK